MGSFEMRIVSESFASTSTRTKRLRYFRCHVRQLRFDWCSFAFDHFCWLKQQQPVNDAGERFSIEDRPALHSIEDDV
jgi:hypothetical protein